MQKWWQGPESTAYPSMRTTVAMEARLPRPLSLGLKVSFQVNENVLLKCRGGSVMGHSDMSGRGESGLFEQWDKLQASE